MSKEDTTVKNTCMYTSNLYDIWCCNTVISDDEDFCSVHKAYNCVISDDEDFCSVHKADYDTMFKKRVQLLNKCLDSYEKYLFDMLSDPTVSNVKATKRINDCLYRILRHHLYPFQN